MGNRKNTLPPAQGVGEDDLLAELAAQLVEVKPLPGEVTVKMLMERSGRSRGTCRDLLDGGVLRGELVKRVVGRNVFYSKKP